MDYQRIYNELINHALLTNNDKTTYYEKHHILPKSMCGSNEPTNLVKLTPRQHFIAHLLLVKITKETHNYWKMVKAIALMNTRGTYNSRKTYQYLKDANLSYSKLIALSRGDESVNRINITYEMYQLIFIHGKSAVTSYEQQQMIPQFSPYDPEYLDDLKFMNFITGLYKVGFRVFSFGERVRTRHKFLFNKFTDEWHGFTPNDDLLKYIDSWSGKKQRYLPNFHHVLKHYHEKAGSVVTTTRKYNQAHPLNMIKIVDVVKKGSAIISFKLLPIGSWLKPSHEWFDIFNRDMDKKQFLSLFS